MLILGVMIGIFILFYVIHKFREIAKPHQSDEYFRQKFSQELTRDAWELLNKARDIRHRYPQLTGPELVHLAYWGVV